MAEYIEREEIVKAVRGRFSWPVDNLIVEVANNIHAADVVPASDFRDCRNELCLKCGAYTQKHNGACNGCRWR